MFHWTPSNSIGYEIKQKTFRPKTGSPVCKVELKGPAAGGAAAPFRYAAPVLALAAGVTTIGYDQFLIIPTRGSRPLPPASN